MGCGQTGLREGRVAESPSVGTNDLPVGQIISIAVDAASLASPEGPRNRVRLKSNFLSRFNVIWVFQLYRKNISLFTAPKSAASFHRPTPQRFRVHWAAGLPCALISFGRDCLVKLGRIVPRDRGRGSCVSSSRSSRGEGLSPWTVSLSPARLRGASPGDLSPRRAGRGDFKRFARCCLKTRVPPWQVRDRGPLAQSLRLVSSRDRGLRGLSI